MKGPAKNIFWPTVRLLENILRELTLRFVVPRLSEFDSLGHREPDLRSLPDQEHLQFAIDLSVCFADGELRSRG